MFKRLLLCSALAVAIPTFGHAQGNVVVISGNSCPGTDVIPVGNGRSLTMTQNGLLCTSASASGTFTDDATGITGSAVPASAAYTGLNVAGNTRGWTGVNPSGSIFAAQVDLASVAGVTVKTGNGTSTGVPRVSIASDNTPFHVIVDTAPTTAVTGTFWQATQPVSIAGTVSVAQGGNSFSNITTATTTAVKSGAGILHTICVNSLGTVASTATVYDNTAGSGTKIATLNTLALLGCQTYDVAFSTGLTIVSTGTVAPDITVSYR